MSLNLIQRIEHPCGNPYCSTSTGIHDGLTFGSGRLDEFGYWEFPCAICARKFDLQCPVLLQEYRQKYLEAGMVENEIDKYMKDNHEWLYIEAWPFPYQDVEELKRQWQRDFAFILSTDAAMDQEFEELFGQWAECEDKQ